MKTKKLSRKKCFEILKEKLLEEQEVYQELNEDDPNEYPLEDSWVVGKTDEELNKIVNEFLDEEYEQLEENSKEWTDWEGGNPEYGIPHYMWEVLCREFFN